MFLRRLCLQYKTKRNRKCDFSFGGVCVYPRSGGRVSPWGFGTTGAICNANCFTPRQIRHAIISVACPIIDLWHYVFVPRFRAVRSRPAG